ncbi:chitin elicitor receptor kinase 1-like [Rhododendron vialii]|uniref:chitin elicitor receptor kinase 1-like n=1 Tax=Rhododendron vialii TaxID=182163 RepID=UPI00265D7877|nr:chitin elicitor receptor kinase 1-like [Rhododendron vialii]
MKSLATTQILSSMRTSSELESTSPSAATASMTEFLGHVFTYVPESRNTFDEVAKWDYANLTTAAMLIQYFHYCTSTYAWFNVTVNCSCGDASVSKEYGLFITYPLRVEDSLESIAAAANLSTDLLQSYNPVVDFSAGNHFSSPFFI